MKLTQVSEHVFVSPPDVLCVMRFQLGKSMILLKGCTQAAVSNFSPEVTRQILEGSLTYEQADADLKESLKEQPEDGTLPPVEEEEESEDRPDAKA